MTLRCYQNNFTGWWWITALHRGTSISQLSLSIPVAHEKAQRGWDGFNKRCTRRSKRAQGAWNGGRKETPLSWYGLCTAWGRTDEESQVTDGCDLSCLLHPCVILGRVEFLFLFFNRGECDVWFFWRFIIFLFYMYVFYHVGGFNRQDTCLFPYLVSCDNN